MIQQSTTIIRTINTKVRLILVLTVLGSGSKMHPTIES